MLNASLLLLACLPHCNAQGSPQPPTLSCRYTNVAPLIDGVRDDLWSRTKPLKVVVAEALGGDHPHTVEVRSLYTKTHTYFLAKWADATKSDMRDPYVWNAATGAYDRPSLPDDQFAIEFPIKGDFAVSMLTTKRSYTADVWHWKAGRGNPIGWVDDKYHIVSATKLDDPKAVEHKLHSNRSVWILRAQDSGTSAYKVKDKPMEFSESVVDSFIQQVPSGSLADVRGKGIHNGDGWTLEMSRKLATGNSDDAVVDPTKTMTFAIAVLNDELYEEHSVSTAISLRFVR